MWELRGNFEMESTSYDSKKMKETSGKKSCGGRKEREIGGDEGARPTAKCHYVFIFAIEIEESGIGITILFNSPSLKNSTSDFKSLAFPRFHCIRAKFANFDFFFY